MTQMFPRTRLGKTALFFSVVYFFRSLPGISRVFHSLEQRFETLGWEESHEEEEVQEEMRWKQALRDEIVYVNNALLNVALNPWVPSGFFLCSQQLVLRLFGKLLLTSFRVMLMSPGQSSFWCFLLFCLFVFCFYFWGVFLVLWIITNMISTVFPLVWVCM